MQVPLAIAARATRITTSVSYHRTTLQKPLPAFPSSPLLGGLFLRSLLFEDDAAIFKNPRVVVYILVSTSKHMMGSSFFLMDRR